MTSNLWTRQSTRVYSWIQISICGRALRSEQLVLGRKSEHLLLANEDRVPERASGKRRVQRASGLEKILESDGRVPEKVVISRKHHLVIVLESGGRVLEKVVKARKKARKGGRKKKRAEANPPNEVAESPAPEVVKAEIAAAEVYREKVLAVLLAFHEKVYLEKVRKDRRIYNQKVVQILTFPAPAAAATAPPAAELIAAFKF